MDKNLECLKKCRELLGLEKAIAAAPLSVGGTGTASNVGVQNVVYKQKTGHTSFIPKKGDAIVKPIIPEIKAPAAVGLKQVRLGNNKTAFSEV
jgi:hypothetical protein